MERSIPRRRLFEGMSDDETLTPRSLGSSSSSSGTPKSGRSIPGGDSLLDSPSSHPISAAFLRLQDLTYGKSSPPVNYTEILFKPETQFEKIIQKSKEFLTEVNDAIIRIKSVKDLDDQDIIDTERESEKTIIEVTKIAQHLQRYIDEAAIRRANDAAVNPRVVSGLKSNEAALNELCKNIKESKRELQLAMTMRERKDLLNEWSPFDRASRARDAEEMISDSTERLMNSKRILLETIQASSGTLGSLATSSQSIQKNDEELNSQSYMVSSARSLLKKYGRRASTDKISIWLGFIFFGFCALIVAYRRLF